MTFISAEGLVSFRPRDVFNVGNWRPRLRYFASSGKWPLINDSSSVRSRSSPSLLLARCVSTKPWLLRPQCFVNPEDDGAFGSSRPLLVTPVLLRGSQRDLCPTCRAALWKEGLQQLVKLWLAVRGSVRQSCGHEWPRSFERRCPENSTPNSNLKTWRARSARSAKNMRCNK